MLNKLLKLLSIEKNPEELTPEMTSLKEMIKIG
jgi:hypothetical protein